MCTAILVIYYNKKFVNFSAINTVPVLRFFPYSLLLRFASFCERKQTDGV